MTEFSHGRDRLLRRRLSLRSLIIAAAMLDGCSGTPATQGAFMATQTLVRPPCITGECGRTALRVLPKRSTIQLNQQITLHDKFRYCLAPNECGSWHPVVANWSSSGGSLQVISGGMEADFSASSPGAYKIVAGFVWQGIRYKGKAWVMVSSPSEMRE
ncbi:MAG: hypothetical protein WB609_01990 [Candidatus Cybelea sp.]